MVGHFQDLLEAKVSERPLYPELTYHPIGGKFGRTICQWHFNEMDSLLTDINRLRCTLNKQPISAEALYDMETSACGHVDYLSKLSVYATDLVFLKN